MKKTKQDKPIALVDMDGTIADFDGAMKRDLAALRSPGEEAFVPSPDSRGEPAWFRKRKRLIKSQPGWWEELPIYEPGMQIIALLREFNFVFKILTKGPWKNSPAWMEKVNWCKKHVPKMDITITEDKSIMYGKILIDDWPPYGNSWLEHRPRGLLIVPAHPWNTLDAYPEQYRRQIFRYESQDDLPALRLRVQALMGVEPKDD